jgi:hypothetical protein
VEEPSRANQQLYNLARGHALIEGRNYITLADIPLLIKVVLSTAPITRVAIFQMLVANNGTLKTADIMEGLGITRHTVHKAMTELGLLGLVDVKKEGEFENSPLIITLKDSFRWCLGSRFRQLQQGFLPTKKARKRPQTDKKSSNRGDNVESLFIKCEEKSAFVKGNNSFLYSDDGTRLSNFINIYGRLAKGDATSRVSESAFRQDLVSSGIFTAPEAALAINEAIEQGLIKRTGYDVLENNSKQKASGFDKK